MYAGAKGRSAELVAVPETIRIEDFLAMPYAGTGGEGGSGGGGGGRDTK